MKKGAIHPNDSVVSEHARNGSNPLKNRRHATVILLLFLLLTAKFYGFEMQWTKRINHLLSSSGAKTRDSLFAQWQTATAEAALAQTDRQKDECKIVTSRFIMLCFCFSQYCDSPRVTLVGGLSHFVQVKSFNERREKNRPVKLS